MGWLKSQVHFDQPALEATFVDYVHEVSPKAERIVELEKAMDKAMAAAQVRGVIDALRALRGVAKITAVTIVEKWDRFPALTVRGR